MRCFFTTFLVGIVGCVFLHCRCGTEPCAKHYYRGAGRCSAGWFAEKNSAIFRPIFRLIFRLGQAMEPPRTPIQKPTQVQKVVRKGSESGFV